MPSASSDRLISGRLPEVAMPKGMLWARSEAQCVRLRETRVNERYLPGATLPAARPLIVHSHLFHANIAARLAASVLFRTLTIIDELPASIEWLDVARVGGTACILGVLSTLYPAWSAARTQPAEALRHEV